MKTPFHSPAGILLLWVTLVGFAPPVLGQPPGQSPSQASDQALEQALAAEASITDMQQAMASGAVTAEALVEAHLLRIATNEQQGAALNTLIRLNPQVREQARALDAERREHGPRGPLHGIPVILKDNFNTAQMPTTGGSMALIDFQPEENATQVQHLLDAGVVILGKANLHEFAYGITSISSLGGQTRNPYDPARVPGGSSGGTAAAVAAGFAAFGMGSDTCGSIRIPAAYNNLVGLRPTKGLSSIHGVMPLSTTQDVAGPLARSVRDLALVLDVVSGSDPRDPATTALLQNAVPPSFVRHLGMVSMDGVRIGVLTDYMERAEPAMRVVLDEALAEMQRHGAELVPFVIPDMESLLAVSGVIGLEFEADLNAYLSAFGSTVYPDLASIVESGLYHAAVRGVLTRSLLGERDETVYQAALDARGTMRVAIEQAMVAYDVDVVAYPPITHLPVLVGDSQPGNLCRLSAHSDLPALSLPAGFTDSGLPVGIELLGPHMGDAWLVGLGYAFEQATGWRLSP